MCEQSLIPYKNSNGIKQTKYYIVAGEKMKILNALINQLLTYVACRDFVEDNFEKLRQIRYDLKQHQWTEQRRERDESTFW